MIIFKSEKDLQKLVNEFNTACFSHRWVLLHLHHPGHVLNPVPSCLYWLSSCLLRELFVLAVIPDLTFWSPLRTVPLAAVVGYLTVVKQQSVTK